MYIQPNKTSEYLSSLLFYPAVTLCAVIIVAVNAIKAVGRQFSEPDSYLHQYDAYLTEKTISYGNDLIEYGFSFFTQKKVEVIPQKVLESSFDVEHAVKEIIGKAHKLTLIHMDGKLFDLKDKETVLKQVATDVEKVTKEVFSQKKPNRFYEWSDSEFKENILYGVACRHMNVHMKVFLASLKPHVGYFGVQKSKSEQLLLEVPKGSDLKIQEVLSTTSSGGSTPTEIPSWGGFASVGPSPRSNTDTI